MVGAGFETWDGFGRERGADPGRVVVLGHVV
jgi:hypothetical protein